VPIEKGKQRIIEQHAANQESRYQSVTSEYPAMHVTLPFESDQHQSPSGFLVTAVVARQPVVPRTAGRLATALPQASPALSSIGTSDAMPFERKPLIITVTREPLP
jgi:hypothetical protein